MFVGLDNYGDIFSRIKKLKKTATSVRKAVNVAKKSGLMSVIPGAGSITAATSALEAAKGLSKKSKSNQKQIPITTTVSTTSTNKKILGMPSIVVYIGGSVLVLGTLGILYLKVMRK